MYIYFIQAVDGGPIKIGRNGNGNIKQRLIQIQVGNPKELQIIGLLREDIYTEKILHEMFSKYLIRGEWFKPVQRLLRFIQDNCENINIRSSKRTNVIDMSEKRKIIAAEYEKVSTRQLSEKLDISIQAVRQIASNLNIKKPERFGAFGRKFPIGKYKNIVSVDWNAYTGEPLWSLFEPGNHKWISIHDTEDEAIEAALCNNIELVPREQAIA